MNERIKELAKQCGYWSGQTIEMNDVGIQRFAELIIRECMNLVENCYADPESGQSPYRTACASTIIEEHFGIEK